MTTIDARPFCPYEVATPAWLAEHCHAARKGVCVGSHHLREECWASWLSHQDARTGQFPCDIKEGSQ